MIFRWRCVSEKGQEIRSEDKEESGKGGGLRWNTGGEPLGRSGASRRARRSDKVEWDYGEGEGAAVT